MINPSPKYSGEPSAQALASGLATLGRYGDSYMVHAAEGETMIPKEVFDENPGLKQELVFQMKMMGIKDPDRFVVGNALNSINPITGQPEFWFKPIKRFIKKVFKKIVPIAAPIIGNMIAPGIGGLIASGLVTKLQGGSWGDALKSAALSYAGSALTSGVGGLLSGTQAGDALGIARGGTFMGGLSEGLTAPFSAASNLFSSGAQNPLAQGIFGPRGTGTIFSSLGGTQANPSAFAQGKIGILPSYQTSDELVRQGIIPSSGAQSPNYSAPITAQQLAPSRPVSAQELSNFQGEAAGIARQYSPGMGGSTGPFEPEAYIQARSAGMNVTAARDVGLGLAPPAPTQTIGAPRTIGSRNPVVTQGAASAAKSASSAAKSASSDPGFLQRNLGATGGRIAEKAIAGAIVPVGIAAVTYALTPEEQTVEEYLKANPQDPARSAYDQWQGIEDKSSPEAIALKNKWYGESQYSASQLASSFGAKPLEGITTLPGPTVANAGSLSGGPLISNLPNIQGALPLARASGGEVMGPGTGTSDSIPARLSDGEFVMTAKAVRNAGNGNRDVGAARMYDMMNRFERGVA